MQNRLELDKNIYQVLSLFLYIAGKKRTRFHKIRLTFFKTLIII